MPTRRLLPLALLSLLLWACSDTTVVEVRNEEGVVTERYTIRKADSVRHGPVEVFDQDGVLIEEGIYVDDALQGLRRRYYPDGTLQAEETLVAGRLEGPYRSYYPDGQLELESQYVDHVMTGTLTGYYPGGAKKEEVTMTDNLADGPFREWHPNGAIKAEGHYVQGGEEQGELLIYDERGELERKMYCVVGTCRTTWPEELIPEDAGEFQIELANE